MRATDAEALAAFGDCSRAEGIIPALESAHALALVARERATWPRTAAPCSCACRAAATRTSKRWAPPWASVTDGAARIRAAFRRAGRPLFIPYVMGGFPDLDAARPTLRRSRATRT